MGERPNQPFQLSFNASLKVDFQGSRVTSDAGLILVRELDERLGFGELIEQHLLDSRAKNTRLPFADLLRQSVYSRLAGYEDVNDAQRLEGAVRIRINPHKNRTNSRPGRSICEGFPDERAQPVLERESRESRGRGCTKPSGF